jgi:hypothetical protein
MLQLCDRLSEVRLTASALEDFKNLIDWMHQAALLLETRVGTNPYCGARRRSRQSTTEELS